MKFLYGLAFAVIFFEGFFGQCESAGGSDKASSSASGSKEAYKRNIRDLPIEILVNILQRLGLRGTRTAASGGIIDGSLETASRLIKKRKIHICPVVNHADEDISEYTDEDGDNYYKISGLDNILRVFECFNEVIKEVKVDLEFDIPKNIRILRKINEKIMKTYSKQFTELHMIIHYLDKTPLSTILKIMPNGGEKIVFPNVKKFVFQGSDTGKYDLNSIFPNLETLIFKNNICFLSLGPHSSIRFDLHYMDNVTKLKELQLKIGPVSYKRYLEKLGEIFKNNENLSTIAIVLTDKIDILYLIQEHVKNVKTLKIHIDSKEFLEEVHENQEFKMQKLKRLIITTGTSIFKDRRISSFINGFKKFKKLDEIVVKINLQIGNMKELIDSSDLTNIKETLGIPGRNEKLIMRMWVHDRLSECNDYKSKFIEFNKQLKRNHEPRWEINTYGRDEFYYMTFVRSE